MKNDSMNNAYKICIFLVLATIIFLNGCISLNPLQYFMSEPPKMYKLTTLTTNQTLIDECISACNNALASQALVSQCIMDPMPADNDWVCDISHAPRQDIDNLAENQCHSFINGSSHHFIELSPDCTIIMVA